MAAAPDQTKRTNLGIMDFEQAVDRVVADPRYKKNIEYGEPRSGHPEGRVRFHIAQLEANLERLKPRLWREQDYWKLKFLIHVHDSFKSEAKRDAALLDPQSHASLARAFAEEYTGDLDILNMVQYHDEGYALYQQLKRAGSYDRQRFETLLNTMHDWDLFLIFMIVDGSTEGKDLGKLRWFISEVRRHKQTWVDESWIPA